MIPRLTVYVMAALVLAAHFLRSGDTVGVALCLATPLLFFVRRPWSLLALQALAYVAGIIWVWTAWDIAAWRLAHGQPWLRATAIFVVVAAISALAGVLLTDKSIRERYRGR
jgi:hypothetical protein